MYRTTSVLRRRNAGMCITRLAPEANQFDTITICYLLYYTGYLKIYHTYKILYTLNKGKHRRIAKSQSTSHR